MNTLNFALIGVGGYIAPRHLNAIKKINGNLLAAHDLNDSVGILDSYFQDCNFFTSFERFDRHIYKKQLEKKKIDYISICSPNYVHDAHLRFALKHNCNAICEKPTVLFQHNLDFLKALEKQTNKKIYTILQLRLHPNVNLILKKLKNEDNQKYDVELTYVTSRGPWYHRSWKGDNEKSGGIATNIGIHFFDLLYFLFGKAKKNIIHLNEANKASGYLELNKARVKWYLSIDKNDLPKYLDDNLRTYRSIKIDGINFDLTNGFEDLHELSYKKIISGEGFGLDEVMESIAIVSEIRGSSISKNKKSKHPFIK